MHAYSKFPDSGGAFKVQVYSPFIVVNRTGLPFFVRSVRSAGLYKEVSGSLSKGQRVVIIICILFISA